MDCKNEAGEMFTLLVVYYLSQEPLHKNEKKRERGRRKHDETGYVFLPRRCMRINSSRTI